MTETVRHIRETIDALTKCIRITNGADDRWLAFDATADILEADRAAVALAVLDEVRAQASLEAFNIPESNAIIRAVEAVRSKYAQPGGVK